MSSSISNTRTTRRARFTRRAAIAALATAAMGAGAFAAAGPAFADGPGSSVLSGVVVIPSTLSIVPATGSFTMSATPGQRTTTTPFTISLGSNDSAGYALTESLSAQFGSLPDTEWDTTTFSGSAGNYTPHITAFNAAGGAQTVFATNQVSGNTTNSNPNPGPYSLGGADIITTTMGLTLDANQPGSPAAGYSGAFTYLLTGN